MHGSELVDDERLPTSTDANLREQYRSRAFSMYRQGDHAKERQESDQSQAGRARVHYPFQRQCARPGAAHVRSSCTAVGALRFPRRRS